MIPVNRIKRWPFPASSQSPDQELPSLYGALTYVLGDTEGARIFDFIKRLAAEQVTKTGGIPCILFKDEMGEFASFQADGDEDEDEMADGAEREGPPE